MSIYVDRGAAILYSDLAAMENFPANASAACPICAKVCATSDHDAVLAVIQANTWLASGFRANQITARLKWRAKRTRTALNTLVRHGRILRCPRGWFVRPRT